VVVVAVVIMVDGVGYGKSRSERACKYIRICLILHVKLKFRVCQPHMTCDLLHKGRLE
jgi:hypothetical protein